MTKRGLARFLAIPVLLAVGGVVVQAQAAEPEAQAAPLPAGKTYTVTLLTGDVVTVHTRQSGCPAVTVRPAEPSGLLHKSCGPDGHVRVIPGAVAGLVGTTLDEALFDVTTLIAEGYDDARATELPLIVKPANAKARGAFTANLRGQRELRSIGAVAGRQPKGKPMATLSATASAGKVWLDRKVRTTAAKLDRNLTQVSAPRAWSAGYTGKGTTVAVLDTGIDATHPDVAGKVAATADFTGTSPDAVDGHGHGTHVASTVAGTGAGSGGQRKGVAPEAALVVGKVLDDEGGGYDSQVIAGLEWAAPRADVVNLSLGGWEASDGTDPLSQAVDALTARHGTLVVAAAGNDPTDRLITAPAAAASALTVGAVDGADRLAEFSGRGPLINTHAMKPEIVAPGVDVVAARAAGTAMGRAIDARYTAASGTSMATPHVAGAAALLAQRHPDWDPHRLKAALVGAADPLNGADPYTVGAGRLNAARALGGVVANQAVVDLGAAGAEAKLNWVNTGAGDAAVALSVAVVDRFGKAAPGAAALSETALTVGGGDSGTAVLRVDRAGLAAGFYTATVTARAGDRTAITPVSFYVEPPSIDLTLTTKPLPDAPEGTDTAAYVYLINLDDPAIFAEYVGVDAGAPLTVRVPAGRYSLAGAIWEFGASERMVMTGDPDVSLTADTAVTLDASTAKPVRVGVDGVDTTPVALGVHFEQFGERGLGWSNFAYAWGEAAAADSVFAAAMEPAGVGEFQAYTVAGLEAGGTSFYDLIKAHPAGLPEGAPYQVTAAEKARLIRLDQRFHRLDAPESMTAHKRYGISANGGLISETYTENLAGTRTDYLSPGFGYIDEAFYDGVVTQEGTRTYAPGSRHEKNWVRQPLRPDWFDDSTAVTSGCTPAPISRTRGNLRVQLVDLADEHQRFDCLDPGWFPGETKQQLTLYRDGTKIGAAPYSFGNFDVPASAGTYRLVYEADHSAWLPVSTRVDTAWTFRSAGPRGTASVPVPLLSVDYALPLDLANKPAGATASFTVHQARGVAPQRITSLALWTSVDDGATWQSVPVTRAGATRFTAPLPTTGAVSLRVAARGSEGSAIDQTIIRAYHGA
ncbi:S8 family peptidase [Actinomycetes bacterium KLBMP 9797]